MPTEFAFHDPETAPKESQQLLKRMLAQSGPNGFYAVPAEPPKTLGAYVALHWAFSATSFRNDEKTVIWQSINVENSYHFCVPAHSQIAQKIGVSDEISSALQNETPLPSARLEALRDFTLTLLRNHGNAGDAEVSASLDAGYSRQNILELVLGMAQKTISNDVNHLARTPVDKQYERYAWKIARNSK